MAIKGQWIEYDGQKGYFAAPEYAAEPLPAIIVIPEVWGLNEHIEDVTRRFAAAGYAAFAPDIFVENGKRPEALSRERIAKTMDFLKTRPPAVWRDTAARDAELAKLPPQEATEITQTFTELFAGVGRLSDFIPKLRKAVHHLKNDRQETRNQKVACVGFCMGGGLSALLACEEPELSGAAVYYGSTPPAEKISSVNCPVIGFYGGNDQRVNAGIPAFEEAMNKTDQSYEHYIYEDANHSFFNDDTQSYNVRAVRASYVNLLKFFYDVLSD